MNTVIGKNKILSIKSSDRSSGTPSNFTINLGQYNLNPTYCSFHQVAIPNGFFNVSKLSQFFKFTLYNGATPYGPYVINVTPGNYSASSVASNSLFTALTNAFNTALSGGTIPASFFTQTLDPVTGFYTLSTSQTGWSFTVDTSLGSLDWILGFRKPVSGSAVLPSNNGAITGTVVLDLRAPPCLYIRSSLVSGNYLSAEGTESVLCIVQNSSAYTQTIFQRAPMPELDLFPVSGQISQVQFQITDEWGAELTMDSNQEWELSIGCYFN